MIWFLKKYAQRDKKEEIADKKAQSLQTKLRNMLNFCT